MRTLGVFNLVTLDGYFSGQAGDISWHRVDSEFQQFAEKNATSGKLEKLALGKSHALHAT
jgi:hypothetical protein